MSKLDALTQPVEAAPHIKHMINLGACLDIPTGTFIKGRHGEMILNGGLASLTGVVGIGNNFKSTFMHYMSFTALSRMPGSKGSTYDTEVNIHEWHLTEQISRIGPLKGEQILETGRWVITDKTMYSGDEWYARVRQYCKDKAKNAKNLMVDTPFPSRDGKSLLQIILPTFTEIDSFTEFETADVAEMQDKNDLGESGGNTIHMRQGLAKLRLLMEAPALNAQGGNFCIMTAHIGKESTMQNAGPAGSVPIVKLKHLKNGDKIKGTTDKFTFVTHNCWHAYNASPLINQGTKGPEYPRDADDNLKLDTDLNTVQLRNLRSKSGASGMAITLIVSQSEGVLPSLTEFHHLREQGGYGLEGSNISYALALYPECKLGRTTVRSKIDSDSKLRCALTLTSELCQISYLWHDLDPRFQLTPSQIYQTLKAKGYDWNLLLSTRAWWTYDNDVQETPFLSSMDLLRMCVDEYHPYWYPVSKENLTLVSAASVNPEVKTKTSNKLETITE